MKNNVFLSIFFLLIGGPAAAQNLPPFGLPIDCTPEKDCWVLNYMDMAAEKGVTKDPSCQPRSYDDHKGTDIAIRSKSLMNQGVNVLAAQDGTIEKVRDGEPDRFPTPSDLELVKEQRKECGNAVLIDHGKDIKTLYCHLKNGSIAVKVGDSVKKGDTIAQVGLSGYTEFPHVHFGILHKNNVLDPFTGHSTEQGCLTADKTASPLWEQKDKITYTRTSIYDAGFWDDVPTLSAIDNGAYDALALGQGSKALTFWMVFFGAVAGDTIHLTITDPQGALFAEKTITQDKDRARQFYFIGKKTGNPPLISGQYTAKADLSRTDPQGQNVYYSVERSVTVQP